MNTRKEHNLFLKYAAAPVGADHDELKAWQKAMQRNQLQRARRASPEAKAKEAAASRVSYWQKAFLVAPSYTEREDRAHDKMQSARETLRRLRTT